MSLRHPIAVILCMIMAMALVWSKALLAITMVLLAVNAAIDIQVSPFRIRWIMTPGLVKDMIRYKPFMWVFALFALLYLISVVYATDVSEWWALTHMKLDFLFMPLAFSMLRPFTRKEYMMVSLSMIVLAFWSSLLVMFYFYQNPYVFSSALGSGGSLPTPTNHIRYSIIIALSVVICLFYAIENWKLKFQWERWVYGILAAYFFFFLHVLSVRSGLGLAYGGILLLIVFYLRKLALWKKLALAGLVILAPVVAYKTMYGFQQKINYTVYDFEQFMRGEGAQHSDSERWMSMKAGLDIGNRNPVLGTGPGAYRPALAEYYKTTWQRDEYTRPHNQWINLYACLGIIGVLVFTFVIFYPMRFPIFWKPALMPTLYIMQLLTLLIEHPIDTALGTSMFLLFTLMGLSYQDGIGTQKNE
jgi:O-antigen ligase